MKQRYTIHVPADTRGWGENKRELPALDCVVELDIDLDRIAWHFGRKAARSKGGASRILSGMGRLKVISKREVK